MKILLFMKPDASAVKGYQWVETIITFYSPALRIPAQVLLQISFPVFLRMVAR